MYFQAKLYHRNIFGLEIFLWIYNRRDLEHAFARYGPVKSLDYSTGDPTAIVTYMDKEDAIKARSKVTGTIQIIDGRIIRNEFNTSPSSHHSKTTKTKRKFVA